jgi:hypothetical protein
MVQTSQAWDWGVELRDEERSELERRRGTVAELRRRLEQAHDSLRASRRRERDASQALSSSTKPGRGAGAACARRYAIGNCCSRHLTRPAGLDEFARIIAT